MAARIERLKYLSRETPNVEALTEFTQDEIDAAIYVSKTKQWKPGDTMTLAQAARLVAQVGGIFDVNAMDHPAQSLCAEVLNESCGWPAPFRRSGDVTHAQFLIAGRLAGATHRPDSLDPGPETPATGDVARPFYSW